MDSVPGETRTLRRTMRDLVALTALPAVWAGYPPLQVAEGLADVLLSTLRLDLVYLRLPEQTEGQKIEVARTAGGPATPGQTRDLSRALAPWLDGGRADLVMDVLRTHPAVIIGGILQHNPFFVPPDEFLRELRERAGQDSTGVG